MLELSCQRGYPAYDVGVWSLSCQRGYPACNVGVGVVRKAYSAYNVRIVKGDNSKIFLPFFVQGDTFFTLSLVSDIHI